MAYLLLYVDDIILTVTYLLNRHPTKTLNFQTPYFGLYGAPPSYHHLRVFGCKCYPNLSATDYQALTSALQYLTFTRPDISYAVQQICLYMHDPHEPHLALIKRVLRYIKGTLDYGLQLLRSSTCDLVAYLDADRAGESFSLVLVN